MLKTKETVEAVPGTSSTQTRNLQIVDTPVNVEILHSLRESGYSNEAAIADIIDNSIDTNVKSKTINIQISEEEISIADDGCGMSIEEVAKAFELATSNKKSSLSLGKYGLGLKTASTSIGTRIELITKKVNENHVLGIYDIEDMCKRKSFSIERGTPSEEDIQKFNSLTNNAKSGTVVSIKKLDYLTDSNIRRFSGNLSKEIGRVFRIFLQDGININVNGKKVQPTDPLLLFHKETKILGDKVHAINFKHQGQEFSYKIRIRAVSLPSIGEVEECPEGYDKRFYTTNTLKQGFYVMRNNREIAHSQTLGVYTRDPHKSTFRCEVFLDGQMDKSLGLTFNKNAITRITQGFVDKLREETVNYFNIAKNDYDNRSKRKKLDNPELEADSKSIKEEIDARFNRLGPVIEEDSKVEVSFIATKDKKIKTEKKSKDKKESVSKTEAHEVVDFVYISAGENSPMYIPSYLGNQKIQVALNSDHISVKNYLLDTDKRSRDFIRKLLTALSRGELKKTLKSDEMMSLFDDFRNDVSTELKRLMD